MPASSSLFLRQHLYTSVMSNSNSGGSLPAGYHPPLSVVTHDDHSAWIVIATALGMACFFVFVAARVVVRYSITSGFGRDDWLLAGSVVSTIPEEAWCSLCFALDTMFDALTRCFRC